MGQGPWGLATFFTTALWLDPPYAFPARTHPLSYARLKAIGDRLQSNPDAFAGREANLQAGRQLVSAVGARMTEMASLMQQSQEFPAVRAHIASAFPSAGFATACP
jgi:hypothetical protein